MARLFTRPDAVSALQAGQAVGGIVGLYLLAVALFGSSA
jgi:hypothetical protein